MLSTTNGFRHLLLILLVNKPYAFVPIFLSSSDDNLTYATSTISPVQFADPPNPHRLWNFGTTNWEDMEWSF